jgi:transposase
MSNCSNLLNLGADFEQALNEEDNGPDEPEPPPKSRKKRTPKKDRLPDDLPEERITIIPDEVQADPDAYVTNGDLEIDNNLVENMIRVPALGKKNWLFFGSKDAGETNAIIMTVLLNCKMLGINPEEYLKEVLGRLPHITNHQARELTPTKWLAASKAKTLTA